MKVSDEVGVTIGDESLVSSGAAAYGLANVSILRDHYVACKQALATYFICGTNAQYMSYLSHLRNSFLDGTNLYPLILHDKAYNIL